MGSGVGREAQEGRDVYILMADSWWCVAETNTTLESNYPPIEKKKKRPTFLDYPGDGILRM